MCSRCESMKQMPFYNFKVVCNLGSDIFFHIVFFYLIETDLSVKKGAESESNKWGGDLW